MTQNVISGECPTAVSEDVTSYWEKKLPRIERLLQRFPADQRQLRFNFECGSICYEARTVLWLPTGTLVARTETPSPDHRAAVDEVVDKLTAEIRRHKELIRHDDVYRRKRRRQRDFTAVEPHLSALRRKDDRRGFFEVLRPYLRHLRDHARRELIIAQLEGTLRPGELTVNDLLDEVIVSAWDGWNGRPQNQPLDRWLVRLLHDYLDEKGFRAPDERRKPNRAPRGEVPQPESLHERVREDDPRYDVVDGDEVETGPGWPYAGRNEWSLENNPYWPFVDPIRQDETLPDEQSVEPWRELANDEMRRYILDELKKLPRNQRRAFALHALDGWTIDEIAQGQGRSPDEVRADIEATRRVLRQRLQSARSEA